jgi:hypothetical protein
MWKDLLKQYLAPAGIGALIGAVGVLATTLPQLLTSIENLRRQQAALELLHKDYLAYSVGVDRFRKLLSDDQINASFPRNAKEIDVADRNAGTEEQISAFLKQSREGAYFVWCEGGMSSSLDGSFSGKWLTRDDAVRWAHQHLEAGKFEKTFPEEDLRAVRRSEIDLCP